MRKITFIDHYDSFSFNLIDWLASHDRGAAIEYCAYDDTEKLHFLQKNLTPLVFSPGPKSPEDAPLSCEVLKNALGRVPVLGVCLGFQMMGIVAGGAIKRSVAPRHGLTREMQVLHGDALLQGLPASFKSAAYNSLTLDVSQMSSSFIVSAVCDSGEPQVIEYRDTRVPALGVQFHPESFLSDDVGVIVRNVFGA